MTCSVSENTVIFAGMKHLDSAFFSGTYGVLRGRAAAVIAAIMFLLVFAGGANACHHNGESAEAPAAGKVHN